MFDTGAGRSVIDVGSLEYIGLVDAIKKTPDGLVNASGDSMEVLGVVNIAVKIQNMRTVTHEFTVINTKSYKNILIGRDFMKQFKRVTFDFEKNRLRLGVMWINCVGFVELQEKVRLVSTTKIPARCEQVVVARCKKKYSMLDLDFEPKKIASGVFITKARIVPDVNGIFLLSVLNVSDSEISINGRKVLGHVQEADETIGYVPEDIKLIM